MEEGDPIFSVHGRFCYKRFLEVFFSDLILFLGYGSKRSSKRMATTTPEADCPLHQAVPPDEGENILRRSRINSSQEPSTVQAGPTRIRTHRVKLLDLLTCS